MILQDRMSISLDNIVPGWSLSRPHSARASFRAFRDQALGFPQGHDFYMIFTRFSTRCTCRTYPIPGKSHVARDPRAIDTFLPR